MQIQLLALGRATKVAFMRRIACLLVACAAALVTATSAGSPEVTARLSWVSSAPALNSSAPTPSPQRPQKDKAQLRAELHAENVWKNDLVLWVLPEPARAKLPMIGQVRAAKDRAGAWGASGPAELT